MTKLCMKIFEMRIIIVSISVFLLSLLQCFGQDSKLAEAEIIKLEIDWHNAYKLKDTALLQRVLADEFININSRGDQIGKKAIINALKTDIARYDSIYPYSMQFMHHAGCVAVIGKTRVTGMENGKPFDNLYFWTDIFIKKQNSWQCVFAQTARLPKPRIIFGNHLPSKDSAIVAEVNISLNKLSAADKFSGVVLISKNNSILYQGAFGLASKENNVLNDFNTAFNLASVTKMFSGVAIAQLAEQGKLLFNDPIKKFLPDLPSNLTSDITIDQLLTHMSGLGSYFNNDFHNSNHAAYRSLNDYVKLIKNDEPQFKPGSKWAYSNTGYLLLGLIVEKVSGISYFDYIKHNIFEKAEMSNADFYESDRPNTSLATPYTKNNRYLNDTANWSIPLFIGPVKGSPAGGAYASSIDMFRFSTALMSNKLLSKPYTNNVILGKVPYGPPDQQKKYAYGFANQIVNGKMIVFHDGGANGISTSIDIYPELGYTVIILSNYDFPAGMEVNNKIRQWLTK